MVIWINGLMVIWINSDNESDDLDIRELMHALKCLSLYLGNYCTNCMYVPVVMCRSEEEISTAD